MQHKTFPLSCKANSSFITCQHLACLRMHAKLLPTCAQGIAGGALGTSRGVGAGDGGNPPTAAPCANRIAGLPWGARISVPSRGSHRRVPSHSLHVDPGMVSCMLSHAMIYVITKLRC